MQLIDGALIVSATDLVGFLECDHLVTLEMARTRGEVDKPFRDDPQLKLLQERGYAHERLYIAQLEAAGRTVVEMTRGVAATPAELRAADAETVEAMRAGTDVIFQAHVLRRSLARPRRTSSSGVTIDRRSSGECSYDIADTKLARRVKAAAHRPDVRLRRPARAGSRASRPRRSHVVTGDRSSHVHQLADYAAYYRASRRASRPGSTRRPRQSRRTRSPSTTVGSAVVDDVRRPSARRRPPLARRQHHPVEPAPARRFRGRNAAELAELGDEAKVAKLPPRILERLRHQAALQLGYRRDRVLRYELIPPSDDVPGQGLAALPEPSPLDVFFDIEADPWALDDGLEYLFGVSTRSSDGESVYHAIWAHDRAGEKAVFEAFVDIGHRAAVTRDPDMHVYHYGGYEPAAIKRLMRRHATREDEVDRLLRGDVFVDLYRVVREGVRASAESYSIKQIEKLYMPVREGGSPTPASRSWRTSAGWRPREPKILDEIAAYNRDDCVSTWGLRDWLEARRREAAAALARRAIVRGRDRRAAPTEELGDDPGRDAERARTPHGGRPGRRPGTRRGAAGPLAARRHSSTGIVARRSPSGGTTTGCVDATLDDLFADASALGGLEFVEPTWRRSSSRAPRATGSTRRRSTS